MLEAVELIKEKEKEAARIIEEAKMQADRIKQEAQAKAEEVFNEAYDQKIAEAKNKSLDLEKKAKEAHAQGQEAKATFHKVENQIKQIQKKAEEKFEEAVNAVLSEIIS